MLPLSQTHLSHLDTCPRKYQHIFFDTLSGPASYEQQAKTQWGSQFHQLMQQQALGLPVNVLTGADVEMSESLAALEAAAPEVFAYLPESTVTPASDKGSRPHSFSQSEHRRTFAFNDYLLTAVYDLVVISAVPTQERGQIFDWKTHQQPPQKEQLAKDWQTRLYPYVLCETTDLAPEDISMTYWFVRLGVDEEGRPVQPSFYRFNYDLAQHDRTRQDLQRLTDALTTMRQQDYFPQVAIEKGRCDRCPFNVRCDRRPATPATRPVPDTHQLVQAARHLTIETVEEIPL